MAERHDSYLVNFYKYKYSPPIPFPPLSGKSDFRARGLQKEVNHLFEGVKKRGCPEGSLPLL